MLAISEVVLVICKSFAFLKVLPFKIPHSDSISRSCVEECACGVERNLIDLVLSRRNSYNPVCTCRTDISKINLTGRPSRTESKANKSISIQESVLQCLEFLRIWPIGNKKNFVCRHIYSARSWYICLLTKGIKRMTWFKTLNLMPITTLEFLDPELAMTKVL